ncbi:ISNCY family transposase (plasmid) [Cereibacter sphaeroides]|uniref:ISNCY family transposase n=1 Tax=Cereibacter sphaeroides TaxID=1063 RepID=UPI000F535381|nr:ISNCY family transposase [Cereibacter sphaeroides]AZB66416.1 ISNCY family transposase [Cereibacter sphaeroides]AZB71256.1 ISNCY family transposase [Cereibacter sphaeroides]
MGWVLMSERELNRIEILSKVLDRRMTTTEASGLLAIGPRQVQRLLRRLREDGAAATRHGLRGRPSNHRLSPGLRDLALALVRETYVGFGPTLAAEKLAERDALHVSRETLRKWMVEDGLWLSRPQRRRFHQPRLRREHLGELVQIDGSDHRWFEDSAPPCTLLVFIDDATSRLMEMRFVPSESTFAYFAALECYLTRHGRPTAFYSDKHSVFRVARQDARTGHGMTQFGRALAELNVEILCANSSQAKGRVERANRTLQDRLVKEMRLAGISDMAAGNAFLPGFIERHNAQFARVPARPDDRHRPLNLPPDRLADILCWRDQRYVGNQLTFTYEHRRILLEESDLTRGIVGKYVDTYAFPDGRFEARWKGISLPYRCFDPEQQHVTHAAITANKRLSDVLALARSLQESQPPRVSRVGRQRTVYEPTGRRNDGWNSKLARRARQRADGTAKPPDIAAE